MSEHAAPLRADDIAVIRGETRVLDGVSLAVEDDTRLLIRGPSGSGKSTLFEVLGLLSPPDDGQLFVKGEDASGLSERRRAALRRTHIGLVFQDFQLIPDLTAWENARVPQEHVRSQESAADESWLNTLFEELGVGHLRDQYPATLSGGERQRIAIARALANRPSVVLADEPTGQLDPETSDRVLDLLFEVQAQSDAALVMISHDRSVGNRFATQLILENGGLTTA